MCSKGWIKRGLPFLATFAFGLLVASFFVDIGPRTGYREHRMRRFQEMQRLRMENDELRQENLRLRNKTNMNWDDPVPFDDGLPRELDVTKPVLPPAPPPPPHLHR